MSEAFSLYTVDQ